MARSISTAGLNAINDNNNNGEVWLYLVEIDSPVFTDPVRVCNNNADIVSGGNTYYAWGFTVSMLADTDDNDTPSVKFTVDNVDQSIVFAINAIPIDLPPTVSLSVIRASAPDTIEIGPIVLPVTDLACTSLTVEFTIGLPAVLVEQFPGYTFNPTNSPGMFVNGS